MFRLVVFVVGLVLLSAPQPAEAYIGPGAGFALLSSFLVVFTTILIAMASLLIWPFRMVWRFFRRKTQAKPLVKRLIIVGFDGQDPKLTEKFMKQGMLPNMEKLAKAGLLHQAGDYLSGHFLRSHGRRSRPAPTPHGTTSSTFSIAIAAPICRFSRRRTSVASSALSRSAPSAFL